MPKRDEAPIGAPAWIELMSSDADTSRQFYGDLFGWTSEDAGPEYGGYVNFSKDGVQMAGCMRNDGQSGAQDGWFIYLATDDAETVAKATEANGGQVLVQPMAVMDLGTMAVLVDAGGAAIGAWQPGTHKGFGIIDEPGAPSWFELFTREYDTSVSFYRDVFKWETSQVADTPEFRYTTLGEDDAALAGIMDATGFLPDGVPAHWSVYFHTANADASLSRIVELGGTGVTPAETTPYGRLATVADPTGTVFKLRQPPT